MTLLGERDLASRRFVPLRRHHDRHARLRRARRSEDLQPAAARLRPQGGNLVVLYNTQELVPNTFAPFPGAAAGAARRKYQRRIRRWKSWLPPIRHSPRPNRITLADFDGWVEQRGSKFFTKWDRGVHADDRHPTIKGQSPQSGGWLTAHLRQRSLDVLRLRLTSSAPL